MDLSEVMRMAGRWREGLAKAEAAAREVRAVGEAGGGLVRVTVDGGREVKSVEIDPGLWGQEKDRALAQDLVRAATNAALARAAAELSGRQGEMLRGIGLDPALLEMLGGRAP